MTAPARLADGWMQTFTGRFRLAYAVKVDRR